MPIRKHEPDGPAVIGPALRPLFDALPDALVVVDAAGTIIEVNRLAAQLFGYADRELVVKAVRAALDGPEPYAAEYRCGRSDGAPLVIQARGEVTRDQDGRALRMLGTVQDVTERKAIEEELVRRRAEAACSRSRYRHADPFVGCG